jgi:aminoglycoside 6'-N-acetyltransferase
MLTSRRLVLRPPAESDVSVFVALLAEPEVACAWPGYDEARVRDSLLTPRDVVVFAIESDLQVIGAIQYDEVSDPDYKSANVDIFLGAHWQRRGFGQEAIRSVIAHLFSECGHHRITIDPAVSNSAAIRTYERVGFRPVGLMRQYERGPDGRFHDALLMELLRDDFHEP